MQTVIEILPFALGFLFLVIIVYFSYVFLPFEKMRFLGMKKGDLYKKIENDLEMLKIYIRGIESAIEEIDKRAECFNREKIEKVLPEEKEEIIQLWSKYLNYQMALSRLTDDYKYFYQINYYFNRSLHIKAFFIGYASFIASYRNGIRVIDYVSKSSLYEKILNDENVEYGIEFGVYDNLKWNVLHFNDVLRLTAGYENLKFLEKVYKKNNFFENNKNVFDYIEKAFHESVEKLKKESIKWFPRNGISIFKKKTYTAWFPVQKEGAKQLGKTRVSVRHENFVTKKQIIEIKKEMFPGDIMVQRRNWYLSNIGIPGFWPHAALYIGNYKKFIIFFEEDEEVKSFLFDAGYKRIEDFLKFLNNKFYKDFREGQLDVFEARAPGVMLNTMEISAKADYVGVLRPNIEKIEILKAIISGVKHYGKPYDYHFDFITDSALVCSELVYKIYQNSLNLELGSSLGRPLFTATDIVKKFDKEFENEERELDFVCFLNGIEKSRKAMKADVDSFRKTWMRPKWDIVQE